MQRRFAWAAVLAAGLGLAAWLPAWAVITRLTPLRDVLGDSQIIFTAQVESLDPSRPGMILTVDETLKGKVPFARVPVALKGHREAERVKQTQQLLKRLAPKLPLVVFVLQRDREYTAFAYTNGTWFQMTGTQTDDGPRWAFTHCEPYLRKTFKGPTAELRQVVADVLAGKAKPPEPDKKEKPGLGPEVETAKPADDAKSPGNAGGPPIAGGPLFAVIPTVGAPVLALLAMLFPALFGGLMLVLRRWMAGLSVLSLNSTLYLVQSWLAPSLLNSWWGTPQALWLAMAAVTLLGLWWAWRRQLREPAFRTPGREEIFTLVAASLGCGIAALWLPHALAQLDLWGKTLFMFAVGLWVATLHSCYLRWVAGRRKEPRPGLPGEGALLWGMLAVGVALAGSFQADTPPAAEEGPYRVVWRFKPPVERCWIASSPRADGERVYIAAVFPSTFKPGGALYCLGRAGKVLWVFNDGGKMKDVFSSPCVADGKVYIGEGMHQSQDCKLYCLDAATGKKLWEFQTASHTESSPTVAGGKVYFGAGDDGLYCLDAGDGKPKWHLEGLHVDANPLVIGGRVYAGSGHNGKQEQAYLETVLFCLDAETGKEHWRIPTEHSVWGQPTLDGGRLFVGLASGDFLDPSDKPGGVVLCVDAASGRRLWRCDLADGVLGRVAVDAECVYFGCRDGRCYAADRKEGVVRWKTDLGSPIVTSPVLAGGPGEGKSLYVATRGGRLVKLDAATGNPTWAFEAQADTGQEPVVFSSPAVVPEKDRGDRRRIYFGCALGEFNRGVLYCLEDAGKP
jgi:outer membrane protein assembly factor BamB